MRDRRILPQAVLENAEAIAVVPNVVQGALGFGGRWGKGLLSRRDRCGNWLPPSFVNIAGGSFGFQIGVEATDLVLVFTDAKAVDALLSAKLRLGADATATAGPIGRRASIGTDILFKSAVYSYSRSKGVFAGVSLDGATVTIDDSSNRNAYSRHLHGEEILRYNEVSANVVVQPFMDALNEYAPPRASRSIAVVTTPDADKDHHHHHHDHDNDPTQ
jgi:lipid-binding SYLF domain-containing protein